MSSPLAEQFRIDTHRLADVAGTTTGVRLTCLRCGWVHQWATPQEMPSLSVIRRLQYSHGCAALGGDEVGQNGDESDSLNV